METYFETIRRSEAESYFKQLIKAEESPKVKAVIVPGMSISSSEKYETDENILILLENGVCWEIEYRFIDGFNMRVYRPTESEIAEMEKMYPFDCFNCDIPIADYPDMIVREIRKISLEYGRIKAVVLGAVDYEYEKWEKEGLVYVNPTDETFRQIDIIMDNQNSITIYPEGADMDGYTYVFSEDAEIVRNTHSEN